MPVDVRPPLLTSAAPGATAAPVRACVEAIADALQDGERALVRGLLCLAAGQERELGRGERRRGSKQVKG